ncbi:MAG: GAF domain-containing protein [Planctomycetota bacterium]|nr:MAG: GAF domain-containing protein [Planctomycetota bacterium]
MAERDDREQIPPELAAFAKNPRQVEAANRERRRGVRDKSLDPVQPMRPTDTGELTPEARRLNRLLEINKAINAETELDNLLVMIMDSAIELSSARRGFLVLWDQGEMQVVQARNIDKHTISSPEAAISRRLIKEAIERRETVVTARASTERDGYASATGLDLKSVMVSPLLSGSRILGALYLDEPEKVGVFQADDVRTLESFCDQAAIAIQNARRIEELHTRMESQRMRLRRVEAEVRRRDQEEVRTFGNLKTSSPKLKRVFDLLARVAETNFPVIIQGESGTGKELLAKAIHYTSLRRDAPFVPMNCAAVPETLLDSELFGYNAGAFTGATRAHRGLFEQAHTGTLFLDEIEEMSPGMQGKLLRALQEGEIRRVGAKDTVKVDVRVIAATNRDIQAMVERGEFRRDLYYRLNVIPVEIPPLRERLEDLPEIVHTLLERLKPVGRSAPSISLDAIEALSRYRWPGNVRELENELKRLIALGVTDIQVDDLSDHIRNPAASAGATAAAGGGGELPTLNIKELERLTIERALAQVGGNKTHAAKLLGLSRRGLLKKLERYREEDERRRVGDGGG